MSYVQLIFLIAFITNNENMEDIVHILMIGIKEIIFFEKIFFIDMLVFKIGILLSVYM